MLLAIQRSTGKLIKLWRERKFRFLGVYEKEEQSIECCALTAGERFLTAYIPSANPKLNF